ncbi:unnamed protein product [Rotaria magnacalcarata]|uniref:Uncharacterized protein n=1 Tax=Rotaria magnacalcarata TaxID=392030 RepID=A0A815DXH4_9BILA|nr:unnamed protein product [Rotaria magnacalcarata]
MFFNIFGETIHSNANETPLQEKPTSSTEKKTRKETHKIRVFPINEDDNIQMRSTARYHQIHNQISTLKLHGHRMSEEEEINLRLGYLGQCLLTQLSYFDHGYSFLTDSLHTIYHGVFKRLMTLWFDSKYRTQKWSIRQHMTDLGTDLRKFRFPSTTTRVPRTIMKYYRLKANESCVILLITYPIFKKYLKPIYYKHFQLLSFAMHIGESRIIDSSKLKEMNYFLEKFVFTFHLLYGKRHCVNTVHSVIHFHQTVKDYGPLTRAGQLNSKNAQLNSTQLLS